jgi:uncharacterized protein (DUF2141 family)
MSATRMGRIGIGLALGAATLALAEEPAGRLSVEVTGMRGRAGTVRCLVFADAAGFPNDVAKAKGRAVATTSGAQVTCTFTEVPEGRFAISVMHDTNDDGKLDSNAFGIPTEGYGFSRDAKAGLFGPPSFDEAALAPAAALEPLLVHLVYP